VVNTKQAGTDFVSVARLWFINQKILFRTMFFVATMWNLWKESVIRAFENNSLSVLQVAEKMKECLVQYKRAFQTMG